MDKRPQRVRFTMADALRARGKLGPYASPEPVEPAAVEEEAKPVRTRRRPS